MDSITKDKPVKIESCKIPDSELLKNKRKLILHVDLRNTIIVADSVTNINIEQAINSYLTGVFWGREVDGKWTWVSDKPSLIPPESGAITYYKYLERSMVSTPSDRAQLRIATGDFTKREIGARFRSYYEKYLPMLRWNNNDCEDAYIKTVCDLGFSNNNLDGSITSIERSVRTSSESGAEDSGLETDGCSNSPSSLSSVDSKSNIESALTMMVEENGHREYYHYILPSFVKLLRHLCDRDREFSIILRTYGLDAQNVLSTIKYILESSRHPYFTEPQPLSVWSDIGTIRRPPRKERSEIAMSIEKSAASHSPFIKAIVERNETGKPYHMPDTSFSSTTSDRRKLREGSCFRTRSLRFEWAKPGFLERFSLFGNCLQHGAKSILKSFQNGCNPCRKQSSSNESFQSKFTELEKKNYPLLLEGDQNIYSVLSDLSKGVYGFVDDFVYWQNHNYSRLAGKPFWIVLPDGVSLDPRQVNEKQDFNTSKFNHDCRRLESELIKPSIDESPSNLNSFNLDQGQPSKDFSLYQVDITTSETHHHIFFDDNIRVNDEDSIVDVRLFDWNEKTWRVSNPEETNLCENLFLVQANLLESIENENYFIEKLELCERNLDNLLAGKQKHP